MPLTFPIQFIDCFLHRKCALFFSLLFYFIFRALWFIFTFANSSYIALPISFSIQFIDCFLHRKCALFFSLSFYFIFRTLWFIFTFANSSYIALLLTFLIQFIDCFLHRKCGLHIPHPLFSCNSLKQVWSFPCTQSCTLLHLYRERERERERERVKSIYILSKYQRYSRN